MKEIKIEHAEEHQDINEVFHEVFHFEFKDDKAKFEWNMYVYAQFVLFGIALVINFLFPNYIIYILTGTIVLWIILYYLGLKKRRDLLASKRIVKVRLTNKDRGVLGYQSLKPENAYEMIKMGDCLIIEVSVKDYYDEMHVKDAISVPLEVLSEKIEEMNLSKDQTILVYSRGESRCKEGAQKLIDLGFEDVYEFGTVMNWPYEVVLKEE